jgi:phospholipid/cholesterol/gamma-HCH transport system substrate-binding protein
VGILTLGGQNKSFAKSVQVQAIFQMLQDCNAETMCGSRGVKIGTVRRIQFHGGSQVAITMNIEESSQKYIHKDAKAKLSTDGLIGNKIIVITGGFCQFRHH